MIEDVAEVVDVDAVMVVVVAEEITPDHYSIVGHRGNRSHVSSQCLTLLQDIRIQPHSKIA